LMGMGRKPLRGTEPKAAAARFAADFERKYGQVRLPFYQDSYLQAVREAQQHDRFLLVYIHSFTSNGADLFCRQILCTEAFTKFLADHNVVFWCGDIEEQEATDGQSSILVLLFWSDLIGSLSLSCFFVPCCLVMSPSPDPPRPTPTPTSTPVTVVVCSWKDFEVGGAPVPDPHWPAGEPS